MIIDVSERIESAKRLTREWAERVGYEQPAAPVETLSKKARDLQRIMNSSNFGCQQRSVHAILRTLIDEDFPISDHERLVEYGRREPFVIGMVVVPVGNNGGSVPRAVEVVRIAQSGNAGLRASNGDTTGPHMRQEQVRPATDEEIDQFFSEFFGMAVNPLDNMAPVDDDELETPF